MSGFHPKSLPNDTEDLGTFFSKTERCCSAYSRLRLGYHGHLAGNAAFEAIVAHASICTRIAPYPLHLANLTPFKRHARRRMGA